MSATSGDLTQLGIALDGTLLVAAWRSARAPADARGWRTHVVTCDATPASIASALADVVREAPAVGEVAVTLLRPLASSRAVAFPPMRRDELRAVLERDWTRYAIGLRHEARVAELRETDARSWRAAFAPAATLEAIDAAAREHGWTVRRAHSGRRARRRGAPRDADDRSRGRRDGDIVWRNGGQRGGPAPSRRDRCITTARRRHRE